ncbi:Embryogenesis-associated protein emb8, partial [Globisporangium splendens]
MPKLKWLFRLLHYKLTAETPQLVYKQTLQNEKLLERCVTMTKQKYYPLWYLFNGHLQTVKLSIANEQEKHPAIPYERQILDMPDGGIVSLDWALPSREDGTIPSVREISPDKRTVIILPGLTGGSGELYIRNAVAELVDRGWQVVVMNARGCANTPLKTAHLFSCAYTDDLCSTVKYLRAKYNFENEAFVGLGFSMGSNVLVKYLGEEKENAGLTAGISVGNPFDLVICSANFGGSLFNRLTYDKAINGNLKALFFEKSNAHEMFQGYPGVDIPAVEKATTVREFDHVLTRVAFKYPTVDHYYSDASSIKKLQDVTVPLLCLSAKDDPISIVVPEPDQVHSNPNVILCVTKAGGHLGFFESDFDPEANTNKEHNSSSRTRKESKSGLKMWSARVIAEFAESIFAHELERKQKQ